MFNPVTGTLTNTAGVSRLTIGILGKNGKCAELKFVAPDFNVNDNPTAPLVAVLPIVIGAEPDLSDTPDDLSAPTEEEMNIHYLRVNDWEPQDVAGIGQVWSDPIGGGDYDLSNALRIQFGRDLNQHAAEGGEICQDDYEYATGTGIYRN